MTDLEITRLCAEAMGFDWHGKRDGVTTEVAGDYGYVLYRPLHDDAQAMALVKKFRLDIKNYFGTESAFHEWRVRGTVSGWETSGGQDLNRAICECVAKMQKAKP